MSIPPQSDFFYKGKWSPACDGFLVDCLIMLKGEAQWSKSAIPSWFLPTAAKWVKEKAGVIFSELELNDRVDLLRKRYYTFKAVLRIRGAYLDASTKTVVAPTDSWEKMLKMNAFAGAYFYQEEPIYARLACVFGLDDVKVEGQTTVVVISDNTEVIHSDSIKINDVIEGEEEVNSPVVFPGPKVRRKLFDEDAEPNDRESTTEDGDYFIDLGPDGYMRYREEKGRMLSKPPGPSHEVGGPSALKSPHASSCGSNSPMKWWPHNVKRP